MKNRVAFTLVICMSVLVLGLYPAELRAVDDTTDVEQVQPGILARIPLAEDQARIVDFRHDQSANKLFATTSDDRLYVLDDSEYDIIGVYRFGGELVLDSVNGRLYVAPGNSFVPTDETPTVRILDTSSLELIDTLEGVHSVSVDAENNRLFAGSPLRVTQSPNDSTTVRVHDLQTLDLLLEIELQGVPTYNPVRNELIVTGYTSWVVDPATGDVLADLLPELDEQPFRWCNGCEHAVGAHLLTEDNLLVIDMSVSMTGGGPGFPPEDVYLNAESLEWVTSFAERLPLQPTCSTNVEPLRPIDDRIYQQERFTRYVLYNNYLVHSPSGEVLKWIEGLAPHYVNERTRQAYTPQGYTLDLETLTPTGRAPVFCWLGEDPETGRIFGSAEGSLLVVGENSGYQNTVIPSEPEPLPTTEIEEILVSPDFQQDNTVFALMEDSRLYRSDDSGNSWMRIQGGLPAEEGLQLSAAFSPDFASDQTLFAGGYVGNHQGEGVLKSEDSGMSWQPMWDGLEHLRIYDVIVSPNYAEDDTVYAKAYYTRLSPWEAGASLFESNDRGATWTRTLTATTASELTAKQASLSAVPVQLLPIRIASDDRVLEYYDDEGNWQPVNLEQKPDEWLVDIVPSPNHLVDSTYYVLGDYSLWRTTDAGESWSRWRDNRLAGRTYDSALTALATTPVLSDGTYKLFVGTRAGEFWTLTPAASPQPVTEPLPEEDMAEEETPEQETPEQDEVERDATESDKAEENALAEDAVQTSDASPEDQTTPAPAAQSEKPASIDALEQTPPPDLHRPSGALAGVWESSSEVQSLLGWARSELAELTPAAYQPFEKGAMIWNGAADEIVVLNSDGTWQSFEDEFEEGDQEFDPSLEPPGGAEQPIRGFGKVWRENQTVMDSIGWALVEEKGFQAYLHKFERGMIMTTPSGTILLFPDGESFGTWRYVE